MWAGGEYQHPLGSFLAYLMSSMFYRDALSGLYIFGGIYAAGVLGWETFQLGVFGIVAALAGAAGAWMGGRVDERMGPKPVITFTILALMMVSAIIITTSQNEVLFIRVGSPDARSSLPTIVFYICGAIIGGAGGSLQAASRTMLTRQADEGRMTEAFGIYAFKARYDPAQVNTSEVGLVSVHRRHGHCLLGRLP